MDLADSQNVHNFTDSASAMLDQFVPVSFKVCLLLLSVVTGSNLCCYWLLLLCAATVSCCRLCCIQLLCGCLPCCCCPMLLLSAAFACCNRIAVIESAAIMRCTADVCCYGSDSVMSPCAGTSLLYCCFVCWCSVPLLSSVIGYSLRLLCLCSLAIGKTQFSSAGKALNIEC